MGYARVSSHAGSGRVLAASAEALARPHAAALKFRQFLGCHDTSPHTPGVRTNSGFCMDCLSDGAKSAGEAVLKRRSLDQFVADTVEATL